MALPIGQEAIGQVIPHNDLSQQLITALENRANYQLRQIFRNPQFHHIPGEMLGKGFVIAIQKGLHADFLENVDLSRIPTDGEWGLGHAVLMAVHTRRFSVLEYIIMHYPVRFNAISPNAEFGIGQALLNEIMHLNYIYEEVAEEDREGDYLDLLVNHPFAFNIDVNVPSLDGMDDIEFPENQREIVQKEGLENMSIHLGILLRQVVVDYENEQSDVVLHALLHHNIAHLFEPNGRFGIGRALVHAAHSLVPNFVKAILNHPKAGFINSDYTDIPMNKTEMEKTHNNLHRYGLTEAIFLAIYKEDYESSSEEDDFVTEKQEIVEAILSFAENNAITLNEGGDFGLRASYAIAAAANYTGIMDALQDFIGDY